SSTANFGRIISVEPLVSIVVPSYNYNRLTEGLIKSVQLQTYRNWQLVVVDDCSTDDTVSILKESIGVDDRIQIILKSKNEGRVKTLNQGFKQACGEYMVGMNADDRLADPCAIEKLVSYLERNPTIGW